MGFLNGGSCVDVRIMLAAAPPALQERIQVVISWKEISKRAPGISQGKSPSVDCTARSREEGKCQNQHLKTFQPRRTEHLLCGKHTPVLLCAPSVTACWPLKTVPGKPSEKPVSAAHPSGAPPAVIALANLWLCSCFSSGCRCSPPPFCLTELFKP